MSPPSSCRKRLPVFCKAPTRRTSLPPSSPMTRRKTKQHREFRCTSQCIDRELHEQFCCATAVQSDGGLPIRDKSAIALLPSDQTLHVPKFQCVGYLTESSAAGKKRATWPMIVFAGTQTAESSLRICAQMTHCDNANLFWCSSARDD